MRRSSAAAWIALAVCVTAAAGCGGRTTVREMSMGRYEDAPQVLFDRTVSGVESLGYRPTTIDAAQGVIVFESAYRSRREGSAEFRVQIYREGWIAVSLGGTPVRRDHNGAAAPGELAEEYRTLVLGLRERVEGLTPGSLGR